MSVVKVLELIGEGKSIEDAIASTLKHAAKTVKNIRQLNVQHIEAIVEKNKIVKYRVNVNLSFVVDN
ncbi:MAG: dodecin family protein [Parachlamydiaceae bacterium]